MPPMTPLPELGEFMKKTRKASIYFTRREGTEFQCERNSSGSVQTRAGAAETGSIHFPCSRIKSFSRSTASASGMLNFTGVLPT